MLPRSREALSRRGSAAPIPCRERLSGWTTSITVHTAVVIAASGFLTRMPVPPSQDFHMELVLSSPSQAQTGPHHSDTDTSPSGSQPALSPPLNRPTLQAPPDPPAEPPLSTATKDHGQPSVPPSHTTASSSESTDAALLRHIAQSTPPAPVDTFHQADNSSVESQPVQSTEPVHSIAQEPSHVETALADPLQADSLPSDRQDSTPSDQTQYDEALSDASPSRSSTITDSADAEGQADTVTLNRSPVTPPVARTALSKPDYGWLMELLRNRIARLQAYPLLARQRGWEGVTVVRATIDKNGKLVNAMVVKSSGHEALDDDALRLMRKACPLPLTQDLSKPKITVTIPIRYRLDEFGP